MSMIVNDHVIEMDIEMDSLPSENAQVSLAVSQGDIKLYFFNEHELSASMQRYLDDQLITLIMAAPEILTSPPSKFRIRSQFYPTSYLIHVTDEFVENRIHSGHNSETFYDVFLSETKADEEEEEIFIQRECLWLKILNAVKNKARLFLGNNNEDYLWASIYTEQNLDELLEYINKLMMYHRNNSEHQFRGEEAYPDDLLSLLENPFSDYDPLDYIGKQTKLNKTPG